MKIFAIICAGVFLFSLIGFAVTTALTGFEFDGWENFHLGFGYNRQPFSFSQTFGDKDQPQFNKLDISIIHAHVNIFPSPDNITRVTYNNPRPRVDFIAAIIDGTLVIKERANFGIFSWGSGSAGELNIQLAGYAPYEQITLNTTSGSISGTLPSARVLNSHTTSGNIALNCSAVESFDISVTSGDVKLRGLSGTGKLRVTSGRVELNYTDWNGDLDARLTSGNLNVTVPSGSGAHIDFSRTSGSLTYSLGYDSDTMTKGGNITVGNANRAHVFKVHLTSGQAEIRTK
jgi:hypothetical protein